MIIYNNISHKNNVIMDVSNIDNNNPRTKLKFSNAWIVAIVNVANAHDNDCFFFPVNVVMGDLIGTFLLVLILVIFSNTIKLMLLIDVTFL